MNAKLVKKLRKRIKPIQVEWMKSLLPDEQADKVTVNNVEELLPDLQHVNSRQLAYNLLLIVMLFHHVQRKLFEFLKIHFIYYKMHHNFLDQSK